MKSSVVVNISGIEVDVNASVDVDWPVALSSLKCTSSVVASSVVKEEFTIVDVVVVDVDIDDVWNVDISVWDKEVDICSFMVDIVVGEGVVMTFEVRSSSLKKTPFVVVSSVDEE